MACRKLDEGIQRARNFHLFALLLKRSGSLQYVLYMGNGSILHIGNFTIVWSLAQRRISLILLLTPRGSVFNKQEISWPKKFGLRIFSDIWKASFLLASQVRPWKWSPLGSDFLDISARMIFQPKMHCYHLNHLLTGLALQLIIWGMRGRPVLKKSFIIILDCSSDTLQAYFPLVSRHDIIQLY